VTVNALIKGKPKTLLHNVSGIAKPSHFTAIMGPSGTNECNLFRLW